MLLNTLEGYFKSAWEGVHGSERDSRRQRTGIHSLERRLA